MPPLRLYRGYDLVCIVLELVGLSCFESWSNLVLHFGVSGVEMLYRIKRFRELGLGWVSVSGGVGFGARITRSGES